MASSNLLIEITIRREYSRPCSAIQFIRFVRRLLFRSIIGTNKKVSFMVFAIFKSNASPYYNHHTTITIPASPYRNHHTSTSRRWFADSTSCPRRKKMQNQQPGSVLNLRNSSELFKQAFARNFNYSNAIELFASTIA